VPGLVRAHLQADTCCPHCGRRPDDPRARLLADVIACPRNRAGRKRTSGCTPAERRTRRTEEATYTITITPSNLPQWTNLSEVKGSGANACAANALIARPLAGTYYFKCSRAVWKYAADISRMKSALVAASVFIHSICVAAEACC
jgi:hypothetical protein